MDEQEVRVVSEDDILDWIIFSGGTSIGEISKRLDVSKGDVKRVVSEFEEKELVSVKGKVFSSTIKFNPDAAGAETAKNRMYPSIDRGERGKVFKTNLDILRSMVDKFSSISVGEAARYFERSQYIIESWGRMLENQGLITLFYPLVGEAYLLKKDMSKSIVNRRLISYMMLALIIFILIYHRELVITYVSQYAEEYIKF